MGGVGAAPGAGQLGWFAAAGGCQEVADGGGAGAGAAAGRGAPQLPQKFPSVLCVPQREQV
jgi:hypothetical protein